MIKRRDWILLIWLISPLAYAPLAINYFQLFEWAELILVSAFANAFFASYLLIRAPLPGAKAMGFTALLREFFILGLTLTFTGLITATTTLLSSITGFKHGIGELLSFYAQLSLNFLIGGVTLVGASLPVLPSLFGQSKGETTSTPQSSRESGGGQQNR